MSNLTQDLEDARRDLIQLLLQEIGQIDNRINEVDAVRTRLLNDILQLRMQYEGVVKQLEQLEYDTSNL